MTLASSMFGTPYFVFKVSRTQKWTNEWLNFIELICYTSSKGDSKLVQIKHLDGTSSFEPFLQIPRTVGSRGFASPTDAFAFDKHSGNLKIDEYFSKITILKITRQIDLVLRYLAHEWCNLSTFFKWNYNLKKNSSNWLGFALLSLKMLQFDELLIEEKNTK